MTNDTKTQMPETPELDKQSQVIHSGKAGAVQEFYDWLVEEGYVLAKWRTESTEPCPGVTRDPFDPSNCEDGKVKKTITLWTPDNKRAGKLLDGETCPKCEGTGEVTVTYSDPPLDPIFIQPEELMAQHFGIDRNKIESERRAILDAIRSQHDD